MLGISGYHRLRFEEKFPIFPSRATPPNLDVVIESTEHVVAIESKFTEYTQARHTAVFSDRYEDATARLAHASWRDHYQRLREHPDQFVFFDATQILKHYLGLKAASERFAGRTVTLLYLFWEPADAERQWLCIEHRSEVARFASSLADSQVPFVAVSYPELWESWRCDGVATAHVEALEARYLVRLDPA